MGLTALMSPEQIPQNPRMTMKAASGSLSIIRMHNIGMYTMQHVIESGLGPSLSVKYPLSIERDGSIYRLEVMI